jgi:transcriptional regulator with XRE-family HTH domain
MMQSLKDLRDQLNALSHAEKSSIESLSSIIYEFIAKRRKLKMSQEKLANMIGVNRSAIAKLENSYTTPNFETLDRIAKALGFKFELVEIESESVEGK